MLKDYQVQVVLDMETFLSDLDAARTKYAKVPEDVRASLDGYLSLATAPKAFKDRPHTGKGDPYPRVCIRMPTGGGKTLMAVETIRAYQNILAKKRTGLVVWITHREGIYRQTIGNLRDKSHPYRQFLDQASNNRTIILEKGQPIRRQDTDENLVVLMLMIQSAKRDSNKIFRDSGGYMDFFPPDGRYDLHQSLKDAIPNLDTTEESMFDQLQVKTSLGNLIRTLSPLIIVDEFHTMFKEKSQAVLDGLNPSLVVGLSATPFDDMNIVSTVTGPQLKDAGMVKLDLHVIAPAHDGEWEEMIASIKSKREDLEKEAEKYQKESGTYIRPIALIQVERTGKDQRGQGFAHSEDVREYLMRLGVSRHEIAVKSSSMDEIREENLLTEQSEVRYIITKEALKEGWDCSFAYILGVIPDAKSNTSMTQLVGRILRQPYAKKTGVAALDESYVFFTKGDTEKVLSNVRKGFSEEGLEGLFGNVKGGGGEASDPMVEKKVHIRKEVLTEYPESLFLPVWTIKHKGQSRRLSYEADILPRMRYDNFDAPVLVRDLIPALDDSTLTGREVRMSLGDAQEERSIELASNLSFDAPFLAWHLQEVIGNAFIAYEIAESILTAFSTAGVGQERLDAHAGLLASESVKRLKFHKETQERALFEEMLRDGLLSLMVSDQPYGFQLPREDAVTKGKKFRRSLYDETDISDLNDLERQVVEIVDKKESVIWWARNKVGREWYAIQGWRKGKFRPDFVIAKRDSAGKLEFVYITESKGEHLMGNFDTTYKTALFASMQDTEIEKDDPARSTLFAMNDRFEFEILNESDAVLKVNTKLR